METLNTSQKALDYPPAPWFSQGQIWMSLFPANLPIRLLVGLHPLITRRLAIVALVRYLKGTLQYDELAICMPVRLNYHCGLFILNIWVNNEISLEGGRHIWGVPKQMAQFEWEQDYVHISDGAGTIADLTISGPLSRTWNLRNITIPGISFLENRWIQAPVYFSQMQLSRSRIHLETWSSRFPYQLSPIPIFSITAPFTMTVLPPKPFNIAEELFYPHSANAQNPMPES